MTFAKHFVRGVALGSLALGLTTSSTLAQNGTNWHAMSNGLDAVYAGLGAGGTQVAGVDGIGNWIDGNDLRGNHVTGLGMPGYRQVAFFTSECVLGAPPAVALDFPAITFTEFDGRNNNDQDIFIRPNCVGGVPTGSTTGGILPYGLSPGASANFLLSGLPTGAGLPSSTVVLLPNNGLAPASNGGSAFLIAAANASLPIASTGFCWGVRFTWTPTALQSFDHIDGWWFWQTNSVNGNQYWAFSNDEGNTYQSNTIALDGGATGLIAFFASGDYEWHQLSRDPSLNHVIAPVGANGAGIYYSTPSFGAISPAFNPNGGGDIGRHGGTSISGVGGSINPITGLGTQSPAGSPTPGLFPTFGFMSWNNETAQAGQLTTRTVYAQIDWQGVLGILPDLAIAVPVGPPGTRFPISVANPPGAGPWPQPVTNNLKSLMVHTTTAKPDADPFGFPAGSFGIGGTWAATRQLNLITLAPVCSIGLPVVVDYGTVSALGNFDPAFARMSTSGSITVVD
jgi:hypothetical protein